MMDFHDYWYLRTVLMIVVALGILIARMVKKIEKGKW